LEKLSNQNSSNIIYIDEAGIDKTPFREFARSQKGEKIMAKISGKRHSKTNIIAGYSRLQKQVRVLPKLRLFMIG